MDIICIYIHISYIYIYKYIDIHTYSFVVFRTGNNDSSSLAPGYLALDSTRHAT